MAKQIEKLTKTFYRRQTTSKVNIPVFYTEVSCIALSYRANDPSRKSLSFVLKSGIDCLKDTLIISAKRVYIEHI